MRTALRITTPLTATPNWVGFGKPVYAPASGVIVSTENDIPDNTYRGRRVVYPHLPTGIDPWGMGNHVIVRHTDGSFSVVFHMRHGSVHEKIGQTIRAGQMIGREGNSGDSFVPHVHYALWQGPTPERFEGLPAMFYGFYRIIGGSRLYVRSGEIDSGDIVENAP